MFQKIMMIGFRNEIRYTNTEMRRMLIEIAKKITDRRKRDKISSREFRDSDEK